MVKISCQDVWKEISNYVDNDVDPDLRARMEAHFKICSHCQAVVVGTKNVVKLIADGVEFEIPEGFSKRLYERIKKS
jgi:hypothetical protein